MTRLNNLHRDAILRAALNDTVVKEHETIKARGEALFKQIFEQLVPKKERELLDKVPKEWLCKGNSFTINAAGWQVRLNLKENYPNKWSWGTINLTDEKLIEAVRTHAEAEEASRHRVVDAKEALKNLLAKAPSFERLKEAWPEGKDYWEPVWVIETRKTLPALDVKSVNEKLGLPKEVTA